MMIWQDEGLTQGECPGILSVFCKVRILPFVNMRVPEHDTISTDPLTSCLR